MTNLEKVGAIETMMSTAAMEKYNACYDNKTYAAAIAGKSTAYANALTDEALALCGHPRYRLSYRKWNEAALAHLANFTR